MFSVYRPGTLLSVPPLDHSTDHAGATTTREVDATTTSPAPTSSTPSTSSTCCFRTRFHAHDSASGSGYCLAEGGSVAAFVRGRRERKPYDTHALEVSLRGELLLQTTGGAPSGKIPSRKESDGASTFVLPPIAPPEKNRQQRNEENNSAAPTNSAGRRLAAKLRQILETSLTSSNLDPVLLLDIVVYSSCSSSGGCDDDQHEFGSEDFLPAGVMAASLALADGGVPLKDLTVATRIRGGGLAAVHPCRGAVCHWEEEVLGSCEHKSGEDPLEGVMKRAAEYRVQMKVALTEAVSEEDLGQFREGLGEVDEGGVEEGTEGSDSEKQ